MFCLFGETRLEKGISVSNGITFPVLWPVSLCLKLSLTSLLIVLCSLYKECESTWLSVSEQYGETD